MHLTAGLQYPLELLQGFSVQGPNHEIPGRAIIHSNVPTEVIEASYKLPGTFISILAHVPKITTQQGLAKA